MSRNRGLLLQRQLRRLLAVVSAGAMVGGCISPIPGSDGKYAEPIGSAPVTENPTPYSGALECLGNYASQNHVKAPHIAVAALRDLTGQLDTNGGRPITQGAQLMAISALGRAGVPLVERYDTDVPKLEFDLANNKLISDEPLRSNDEKREYRAVFPGMVSGSDYFLAGGITEMNTSIRSVTMSASLTETGKSSTPTTPNGTAYVMNIGLDLRLINTNSLDIVDIVSYQKQIIGYQVGTGLFAFFGNQVLSVTASDSAAEPVHLAVRSLVERAIVEMVARLYHISPAACLDPKSDPLKGPTRDAALGPELAVKNSAPPAPVRDIGVPPDPRPEPCCALRTQVQ